MRVEIVGEVLFVGNKRIITKDNMSYTGCFINVSGIRNLIPLLVDYQRDRDLFILEYGQDVYDYLSSRIESPKVNSSLIESPLGSFKKTINEICKGEGIDFRFEENIK